MRRVKERFGVVVPVSPNWGRMVQQEIDFLTDIITSRSGREQRHALRDSGRWSFQFTASATQERLFRLRNDLAEDQTGLSFFATPWRHVQITSTADAEDATVEVAEAPFWLAPGVHVIVQTRTAEEVLLVEDINLESILFTSGLAFPITGSARLYEARHVRYQDDIQFQLATAGVWESNMRLVEVPVTTPMHLPAEGTPETFQGTRLFLTRPDWGDSPSMRIRRERETFDPGRGKTFDWSPVDFNQNQIEFTHFQRSREDIERLIAFYSREKGRRGSFWMPTWTKDILVQGSSATTLTVPGSDFYYAYQVATNTNRHVIAFWPFGGHQINTLTDLEINGDGDTVATFGSSWAQTVTPTTRLHWLELRRFAADKITVDWHTTQYARLKLATVGLKTEEVE